jgi:4-hydroxy-tetrahydrodipicolinate reductase
MKAALIGYGKMGREIERILLERGHTVPLIVDIDNAGDLNAANLKNVDVAIEFSAPDAAFANIRTCLEAGTPVVCGTTAWLDRYDEAVEICRRHDGAFFYASNYSIGVNIFFKINRELARLMNRYAEYDVTIEEVHHTQKKDAPSGTAITLAEGILAGLERKKTWVCGTTTAPDELEIGSIRRSVVPGIHTGTWESPADGLSVSHTIKSRSTLATGAVAAAEFLNGKKGIYNMDNLME